MKLLGASSLSADAFPVPFEEPHQVRCARAARGSCLFFNIKPRLTMSTVHKEQDYKVQIDREVYDIPNRCRTGAQLLEIAGKTPVKDYQLYQKLKGGKVEKVEPEQSVCFDDPGIEKFTTQKKSHQDGNHESFKIQVDRDTIEVHQKCMKGKEILIATGKQPYTDFQLYQKLKSNKVEKVDYEQVVCFDDPGIERFTTQKKHHQDGEKRRRDFKLLPEDEAYLDAMSYVWDTISESNLNYVILRGAKLPSGYNVQKADIAFRFDNGYPRTQLDMAFFFPALSRVDRQSINNLTALPLEGKQYQQWSRHRTADNPWREGIDSLATHIGYMETWLEDEFKKKPHAVQA